MADLAAQFQRDGFVVFDVNPRVLNWAKAAHPLAVAASQDPDLQDKWLRHGKTWFVGVDALPNDAQGAVADVPLAGPWENLVAAPKTWHAAQVSITYDGYPRRDPTESEAAHRFRVRRDAAHVDGMHLEAGRRIVREPHAFILGLPLNQSDACPLVIWPGSHVPLAAAIGASIKGDVIGADVTDAYIAARAAVFENCTRVEVRMKPGQAVLLHRFAVHGVAPWADGMLCPDEGRVIAYFRPEFSDANDWIELDPDRATLSTLSNGPRGHRVVW